MGIAGLLTGVGAVLFIWNTGYMILHLQVEIFTLSFFNDYPWHRKILLFLWYMTWPYWLGMLLYGLWSTENSQRLWWWSWLHDPIRTDFARYRLDSIRAAQCVTVSEWRAATYRDR